MFDIVVVCTEVEYQTHDLENLMAAKRRLHHYTVEYEQKMTMIREHSCGQVKIEQVIQLSEGLLLQRKLQARM